MNKGLRGPKEDLTGQRFGRLVALYPKYDKKWKWVFQCDCGKQSCSESWHVKKGKVTSCGCYGTEQRAKSTRTHAMSDSREYCTWKKMKGRCQNVNDDNYDYYGGRGITVCDKWQTFEGFYEDMGERPEGLTLDRIDVNGNYEADNCRWADGSTQCMNKRKHTRNTSGRTGVFWYKPLSKWKVQIAQIVYGYYEDFEEAVKVIEKLEMEMIGVIRQ